MILKTLMRKKEMQIWKRIVKPTKSVISNGRSIGVDPVDPLRTHKGSAFGALHDQEVDDGSNRKGAVNGADAFVHAFEAEGEKERARY